MPIRTIHLPTIAVSSPLAPAIAGLVGPALPLEVLFWQQVFGLKSLLWWLFGVNTRPIISGDKVSRGYIHYLESSQGSCKLEILRWDPFQECVLLIDRDYCRIALSISLIYSREKVSAQLESECEVRGWRSLCLPIFGILLNHRYRKMGTRLEQLLIQTNRA